MKHLLILTILLLLPVAGFSQTVDPDHVGLPLCDTYITNAKACSKKVAKTVWVDNFKGDIKAIKDAKKASDATALSMCQWLVDYRKSDELVGKQCKW